MAAPRKAAPRKQQPVRRGNAQPGGHQRPPGDVTGRKSETLAKEAAEAVSQREGELGMLTQQRQAVKDEGVISLMDPQTPTLLIDGQPPVELDDELEEIADLAEGGERITEPGAVEVLEFAPENIDLGGGDTALMRDQTTMMQPVLVRALYDQEDITMGKDNIISIKEGYRYQLPRWMAQHLAEKGLVLPIAS